MIEPVLLDTGPLVACLSRRDAGHQCCLKQLRRLKKPPVTCWPVLTEAVWLLCTIPQAVQTLFTMVNAREIRIASFGEEASDYLASFLERYHSLHTDLADAALVFLAEREAIDTVFTLDRKDFSIYRLTNGKALQIIPEGATLVG